MLVLIRRILSNAILRGGLSSLAAALCVGRAASSEPSGRHPASIGIVGAYGINNANGVPRTSDTLDAYGIGIGARASYVFDFGLAVGASFVHHFGYSKTLAGHAYPDFLGFPRTPGGVASSAHIDPALIEAGYEIPLASFSLRPYFGLGIVRFSTVNAVTDSTTTPYVFGSSSAKPCFTTAVAGAYDLSSRFFAGLDLRYLVVFLGHSSFGIVPLAGSANAFEAGVVAGLRL